jgi:hypothetical protein
VVRVNDSFANFERHNYGFPFARTSILPQGTTVNQRDRSPANRRVPVR